MKKCLAGVLLLGTSLYAHTEVTTMQAFQTELKHDGIVVVKFSATWCPPCQNYKKEFEKVASQYKEVTVEGKTVPVHYVVVDTDRGGAIATEYKITSIPATLFFKGGKKVDAFVGLRSQAALLQKINDVARLH